MSWIQILIDSNVTQQSDMTYGHQGIYTNQPSGHHVWAWPLNSNYGQWWMWNIVVQEPKMPHLTHISLWNAYSKTIVVATYIPVIQ